jgi:DNA repair photolyase
MRWDNLKLDPDDRDDPALPLGLSGAAVRRFSTPDFRGITCYEINARSIVNKVPAGSRMPFRWTLNPYRGCTHACTYCFARNTHTYQRVEGRYQLMRGVLEALRDHRNPFSILTKGTLVLRDLDLLVEAARHAPISVSVSIGFVDQVLWRQVEPGTPSPVARLGVCRSLVSAGIGCSVLMAPILPFLTDSDEQLSATIAELANAGASSVTPLVLHLRPGAREWYLGWLRGARPDLLPRYERLYGRGAYAPPEYTAAVTARVRELAREHGIGARSPAAYRLPAAAEAVPEPAAVAEQLPLLPLA